MGAAIFALFHVQYGLPYWLAFAFAIVASADGARATSAPDEATLELGARLDVDEHDVRNRPISDLA